MANKDLNRLKAEINKIGKYKAVPMNTGFGSKEYSIMLNIGKNEIGKEDWVSSRPVKYYKTEAGALREIIKRMKR